MRNGLAIPRKQLAKRKNSEFDFHMREERLGDPADEVDAQFGRSPAGRQHLIKFEYYLLGAFLAGLISILGLVWEQSFVWEACPQALVVKFLRQSQHAYDPVGTVDYPELAMAILYYPLVGWILSRAAARDRLEQVSVHVVIWHIVAIGLAIGTGELRDRLWVF